MVTSVKKLKIDFKFLSMMSSVEILDLSATNLADLEMVACCMSVVSLDISQTKVRRLEPIRGLTRLRSLNIQKAMVKKLMPVACLSSLKSVCLGAREYDLYDLSKLRGFSRAGNKLIFD